MDFSESRRPGSKVVGFCIVVGLHLLLGWALVSGLARRVVEVVKPPVEVSILEEPKAPPPRRHLPAAARATPTAPPPRKVAPPPPSYMPPPEVNVAQPADSQPSITASSVPPLPRRW